jgi:tRNA A-37 threonylcarbamoyl transferase component Bud32
MSAPAGPDGSLALSTEERIDVVCRRFEAAWKAGKRPRLEDYLGEGEGREQQVLLRELLRLDVEYRSYAGEAPVAQDYLGRLAEHADLVRQLFQQPMPSRWKTVFWRPGETTAEEKPGLPVSIGRYRVVERLGRGGQSEVYRAVDPVLGRDVVLKVARPGLSEQACQKLLDEGRILIQLADLRGLVRVLDLEVWEGRPFLVFEHVRGRSLADVLRQECWPLRRSVALVAGLAGTLERIHRKGVMHGDLTPGNVLIDETGLPRLLDFGLASLAQVDRAIGPEGGVSGTPPYMAPEQACGETERLGPRTDVFGLGAVLYHLLTRRPPYQGTSVEAVLEQARQARLTSPRQVDPGTPLSLERTCLKAMAADPDQRYASAGEMGKALRAYLHRRTLAALVLVGLLVLAASLAWFVWPGREAASSAAPEANPVDGALEGKLLVRVWSEDDKPGQTVGRDGALPVRNGEFMQIEARLNRPGHIYLLWVGSGGKIKPLYPWNDGLKLIHKDPGAAPPRREPRAVVYSPPDRGHGWKMGGKRGLDTIVLAARRTPLPDGVSLGQLRGNVLAACFHHPREWALLRGEEDVGGVRATGAHRDPDDVAGQIDHPVLRVMQRLRDHFEVVRAVRFAHEE